MQNATQQFRQRSIDFEKPGILFEKFAKPETLTSSNYHRLQ